MKNVFLVSLLVFLTGCQAVGGFFTKNCTQMGEEMRKKLTDEGKSMVMAQIDPNGAEVAGFYDGKSKDADMYALLPSTHPEIDNMEKSYNFTNLGNCVTDDGVSKTLFVKTLPAVKS